MRASLRGIQKRLSTAASGKGAMTSQQLGSEGRVVSSLAEIETKGKLVLFNNRICPFGHRAWWAMREKAVDDFDYIHIELGANKPAWYKDEVNPLGTVPCLIDDGDKIFESLICAEYLDEKFAGQGTPLMPEHPKDRAAVRFAITSFGDLTTALYRLLMGQDASKDPELIEAIRTNLAKVNAVYEAQSEGPHFLGETFSMADLAMITFIDRFAHTLPHWRGFDLLNEPGCARLAENFRACQQRKAFQETSQPAAFYIQFYESYAKVARKAESNL